MAEKAKTSSGESFGVLECRPGPRKSQDIEWPKKPGPLGPLGLLELDIDSSRLGLLECGPDGRQPGCLDRCSSKRPRARGAPAGALLALAAYDPSSGRLQHYGLLLSRGIINFKFLHGHGHGRGAGRAGRLQQQQQRVVSRRTAAS